MHPRARRSIAALLLAPVTLLSSPARETAETTPEPSELASDAVARARDHRASLERLLVLREGEVTRAARLVEARERQYRDGIVSRTELTQSEQALTRARAGADETRRGIAEADHLIGEALAMEQLAKLPPPPAGGQVTTDTLVRYNGPAGWSLAEAPKLARFFEARFGRPLPLSAVGQTATHDRLGFDHREAIDVAVHPDSAEGQAVMDHLRSLGIPFLAFRGPVPGTATGAHVHVGPPSLRLAQAR